jgi:hypothetical protein
MSKHSSEQAAGSASRWNAVMSAGQLGAAAVTGNLGFAVEGMHNVADSVSFDAKKRALSSGKERALRLRRVAATILTVGGIAGVGGAAHHVVFDSKEDTSSGVIGLAFAGAAINTLVARRTHAAEHDAHNHGSNCSAGSHNDSKLHTLSDAGTGWLYAAGVALEHKIPGSSTAALALNGIISTAVAGQTFLLIEKDARADTTQL